MYILWSKGPVIIYRRGGWGGGGWTILGGFSWFLGEQKGGSVVTENPKGGITENLGKIQRRTTQICLENEDMEGGGGSRKTSTVIRGGGGRGSLQWSNIQKGESAKFHLV